MNKSELVDAIAASASISKKSASDALNATIEAITNGLAAGEKITLPGFGTFETRERAARTGRNPKTGEPMQINAAVTAGFKAGKLLKEAVQKVKK